MVCMQYAVLVMLPLTTIEALLPSFQNNAEGQILYQNHPESDKPVNPCCNQFIAHLTSCNLKATSISIHVFTLNSTQDKQ